MAEFPEDICRLVNQMVPWDRHHRSPVAQIVKSNKFREKQQEITGRWHCEFIEYMHTIYLKCHLSYRTIRRTFSDDVALYQDTSVIPEDVVAWITECVDNQIVPYDSEHTHSEYNRCVWKNHNRRGQDLWKTTGGGFQAPRGIDPDWSDSSEEESDGSEESD